jgi:thioredoxin-related protein
MKLILGLFMLSGFASLAMANDSIQSDSINRNVHFVNGIAWPKLVEMAKHHRKYIFVDCYATWCSPCKYMDRNIFTNEKVALVYNKRFICVKMQMDKSNHDDEAIRHTYVDAKFLMDNYAIKAYPTFLYFDQDGNIINKSIGAADVDRFIGLAADALNPNKNYSASVRQFKAGKRDMVEMAYLAETATSLGDTAESRLIAEAYMIKLQGNEVYTKDNIQFMGRFTKSSEEVGFNLFLRHADTVNKIMGDDTYAQSIVHRIIVSEMVVPELKDTSIFYNSGPDWPRLFSKISKIYGAYYADRAVTEARCDWAGEHKHWDEWSKYFTLFQDKFGSKANSGPWVALSLNNKAWTVFTYSSSVPALMDALSWSEKAVLMDPQSNWIDTYANLLYKLGQKQLALQWESIAVKMDSASDIFRSTLEKMKGDLPTWPTQ